MSWPSRRHAQTKEWDRQWNQRRKTADMGGQIVHTKDPCAPWYHPARQGYLVALEGEALEAYNQYKRQTGQAEASDALRWAFEDWYISETRQTKKQISAKRDGNR